MNLNGVEFANWRDVPPREIHPGFRTRLLWRGENGAKALIFDKIKPELGMANARICVSGAAPIAKVGILSRKKPRP